jgi:two-component system sensor histidine kinase KdpD
MARGTLRIYLGAAPGVGKTFAMLGEGRRRAARGADVVVGYVETHGRAKTADQIGDLECVPRRKIDYRGASFEEMDVDAIIARKPEIVLVDELAHTNVPGSRNAKRWQDIDELLEAGMTVISTVNVQHLESLNDVVERITGIKQQETVPDGWVRQAEQIQLVDQTPEALRRRMAHGNIYPPERIDASLANYFRPGNLAALRELALLWLADRVEERLQSYMSEHGIQGPWETRERVLVAVKGAPEDEQLIRRGARMASRARGDLLCVYVRASEGLKSAAPEQVDRDRELVEELNGTFHEVVDSDVARAVTSFARVEQATQLVIGESSRSEWQRLTRPSIVHKTIRQAGVVDVHVISTDKQAGADQTRRLPTVRRLAVLERRRVVLGWLIALAGAPLLTLLCANLRDHLGLSSVLLLFLCLIVGVAAVGGTWPSLAVALGGSLIVNWFFTPPFYTFTIERAQNALSLLVFVGVGIAVSALVSTAARRTNEAARARSEAEVLARAAATLVGREDPVPELIGFLRTTFGLTAVAILRRVASGWRVEGHSGTPCPVSPDNADATVPLSESTTLALVGPTLSADDRRVLQAFLAPLSAALESRRLHSQASAAEKLAAANELRTALLAAVSHDLRTPLASIKASVTSLLQDEVTWPKESEKEFLETIDSEADRLNKIVGNLLDMSRLQTGGLNLAMRDVSLEELIAGVLNALGARSRLVQADVREDVSAVWADPALLERAVTNIVENALNHGSEDEPVRVEAGEVNGHVHLRVIDRGPGIPPAERELAFRPFQRLGDNPSGLGVGLGLAVARGFVDAMGGELTLDDTPGGGLTVVIDLKVAATQKTGAA